jgi:hypothetical protein
VTDDVLVQPTAEDTFITLASNHVRKVASLEGSKYYGLPIGAPITADLVDKLKAEKGDAPKGALTSEKNPNKGSFSPKATQQLTGGGEKPKSGSTTVSQKIKVGKPTLTGPSKFKVGANLYSAPNGSKLIHPASNPDMAYVYTPDAKVYAFNDAGQIEVPEPLNGLLAQKFAGDLTNDPNYDEADFDAQAASYDMSNLKVGAVLNDKNGEAQFTKQEDGTFKHNALGAVVQEQDIQPLFDNGELVPEGSDEDGHLNDAFGETEAMNFAAMDTEEVAAALDKLKPGAQLSYGANGELHATKQENGTWDVSGENVNATGVTSNSLKYVKSTLKVSDQSTTPDQKIDEAFDKKVADVETKDPSAPDISALEDQDSADAEPEAPATEAETPAEPAAEKPAESAPEVADEPLKKQFKVGQKVGAKDVPDLVDGLKLKHTYSKKNSHWTVANGGKTITSPGGGDHDVTDAVTDQAGWFVHQLPEDAAPAEAPSEDSTQNTNSTSATVSDVTQAIDDIADTAADIPATPKPAKVGDEPTAEWVAEAKPGAIVTVGGAVFTKAHSMDETWVSNAGMYIASDALGDLVQDYTGDKQITALKSEPKSLSNPGVSVGDKPKDLLDILAMEPGTVLAFDDDSVQSLFTKLDNGKFLSSTSGAEIASQFFTAAIDGKKIVVSSLPPHEEDAPGEDGLFGYANGQKITKMGHVNAFPEGTTLRVFYGDLADAAPDQGLYIVREGDGWKGYDGESYPVGLYKPHEFASDINDGALFFDHGPDQNTDAIAAEALNIDALVSPSTSPTHTIGGGTYSMSDLKDAHDILVSDSAFQVKYSLNKLPEGHTFFKNDAAKNDLVDAAKAAFPEEKGKPPVIKLLKQKLGLQPDKQDDHVATGPMIKIGSDSPAMQQTGMDGGEFAYSDIEDAIKMLKSSNSKLFKNELAKKGNPLGDLSPNHLIADPDPKDKEANKKKFIAFLEDTLAKHQPSDEEHVTTPQVDPTDQLVADVYDALETSEPGVVDGKTYLTGQAAHKMPTGTIGLTQDGKQVTKGVLDSWTDENGTSYHFADYTTGVHILSTPSEEDPAPEVDGLDYNYGVYGHSTKKQASSAPIGQQAESSGQVYTKIADNKWQVGNSENGTLGDGAFEGASVTWIDPKNGHTSVDMSATESVSEKSLSDADTALKVGDPITVGVMEDLPVGAKVKLGNGNVLTKAVDGKYHMTVNSLHMDFTPKELADASEFITVDFLPNQMDSDALISADMLPDLGDGSIIVNKDSEFGFSDIYTKKNGSWLDESGDKVDESTLVEHISMGAPYYLQSSPSGVPAYAATPAAVQSKNPAPPKSGDMELMPLLPGKYAGTGKAYMLVKGDGTALYVNSKGTVSTLTLTAAQKNHMAGMNVYSGLPTYLPNVGDTIDASGKKKPTALPNLTLADGTYFSAHPGVPKATVYEVKDGIATAYKPVGSIAGSNTKIDGAPDSAWLDGAGDGAAFAWSKYRLVKKDGSWTVDGKTEVPENFNAAAVLWWVSNSDVVKTWDDLMAIQKKSKSTWWDAIVQGHGVQEPSPVSNNVLQTQIKKGLVTDKHGFSQVPEGYSGDVQLLGGTYSIKTLLDTKKILDSDDNYALSQKLKAKGFTVPAIKYLKPYTEEHFGGVSNPENNRAALRMAVDKALAGVDTELPEANVAGYFEYNSFGEPQLPKESLTDPDMSSMTDLAAWIKKIGSTFGGGGIIGQHVNGMDKGDRQTWVGAFRDGNFKTLYSLEVSAAASKNLPHASGYLHPGYADNADYHKVEWGAAVSGEVSALKNIPGDWSSKAVYASPAEIDNYLIAAQMQNPTFLTTGEKRQWVKYHRANYKMNTDNLSILALNRKEQGSKEYSEPLTWSEDVVPGKSYTSLFDDTKFPTSWSNTAAIEYYNDHEKELKSAKAEWSKENYYGDTSDFMSFWFQGKADEEAAKALIPVYKIDANQTVVQGTQKTLNVSDQFGNKYFFKPRPDTQLDNYRIEAEHAGNLMGSLLGYKSAKSKIVTINGTRGQLQSDVGGIGTLHGAKYGSLSAKTLGDIAKEHVLDWFLDNDDTKGDNVTLWSDGTVVGIDKGRAWKHFGAWSGLSGDDSMNSNADTIYARMFTAMRDGKITKENADAAYVAMQKQIARIGKVQDSRVTAILQDGMKSRPSFSLTYSIDGKELPNTFEGLNAAVLDRKSHLAEDFENMWKGVYADAGYGDLPEIPEHPLGDEIASGLDSSILHDKVFETKVFGTTAMVGGADVIGGTVHVWMDKYKSGKKNIHGESYLAPKKQSELSATLKQYVSGEEDPKKAEVVGFDPYDYYGDTLITAAKTINHHADDGEYNSAKISALDSAIVAIESEREEWEPGLVSNYSLPSGPAYQFKNTGHIVPMEHVDQYKMMLDSYASKYVPIKEAQKAQSKVNPHVEKYTPLKLHATKEQWVNDNGDVLTPMKSGYLLKKGATVEHVGTSTKVVKWILAGQDGWHSSVQPKEEEQNGVGFKVVKRSYTNEKKGKFDPLTGEKTSNEAYMGNVKGSQGSEYEVTLSTGEKIFYRGGYETDTALAQQGKLMFKAEDVSDPADVSTALSNIMNALQALGINVNASEHSDAELTYWREMYGVLATRATGYGDAKYQKANKALNAKVKEVGGPDHQFIENFDEKASVDEQNEFWRGVWGDVVGADKVSDFISSEGYLPKFDRLDMGNPDLRSGKPYWERLDLDLDELLGLKTWYLTSRVGSSDGTILPVVKHGGALSAEERLRILDDFNAGGLAMSAAEDQSSHGSTNNIYMRLRSTLSNSNDNAVYAPHLMLRTRTYSFDHDAWGNHEKRVYSSPADVKYVIKEFTGGGHSTNETVAPHYATILDGIEMYIFDLASERNEAIQELKKRGIEEIRGVPVADRLVMRSKMEDAIAKVKATWAKK